MLRTRIGARKVLCDTGRLQTNNGKDVILKKDNLSYQQVLGLIQSFSSKESENSKNKTDLIIGNNLGNKKSQIKNKSSNNSG